MPTAILLPTATGAHGNDWNQTGGSSKFNAVDPGDPIVHDGMTSRLHAKLNNKNQSMAFTDLSTKVPSAKTVVSMTFNLRFRNQDGNATQQVTIRSASSTILALNINFTVQVPKDAGFFDFSAPLAPADAGDWTVAKADDVQMDWILDGSMPEGGLLNCTSVWIVAEYGELVTVVEPPDETARRLLRRYRFPEEVYRLQLGPRGEQIEMWKDFSLVEAFGPEATGLGFGSEEWESRLLRCIRKTPDPRTGGVTVEAIDVRRYLTMFFLQAISDAPGKTTGTIRMDQGLVETFTRATKAWVEWSDGKAYELAAGDKKHTHLGLLLEVKRTNRILNSAFSVDGGGGGDLFASWVEVGGGLTKASVNPYFADVNVSAQMAQATQTSPAEDRGYNQLTAFSFAASAWVTLSVAHRNDFGGQTQVGVKNITTGNFLQSDGTWASSPVRFKPWPNRTGNPPTRDSLVFQMEATGSTLRVLFRVDTGSDDVMNLAQVDLITVPNNPGINYGTSPIITTTAEVTVDADELEFTNPLGQEAIPFQGSQFTIQAIVVPLFDHDIDLQAADINNRRAVFLVKTNDVQDIGLLYKEDTGPGDNAFAINTTSGGAFLSGFIKPTFNAGDVLKIVYRRSSSRGEYDLDANKDQIMVREPSTGTWFKSAQVDNVTSAVSTNLDFRLGFEFTGGDGGQLDGYMQYFDVRPFVLSEEEAKDFP